MTEKGIRQLWFESAPPNRKAEIHKFVNNHGLVFIVGFIFFSIIFFKFYFLSCYNINSV